MPSSFEQQREMIATFRSVVHSLFTVPEPLLMKDLDGNLTRSRVTTILNRLIDVSILTGASEMVKEGKPSQLAWRFVDETAKRFLTKIAKDEAQISRLLWPDEEPTHEQVVESAPSGSLSEEEPAAPQDPVSLVAAVLEGFNDRLVGMEQRTAVVDAKLDHVVGGMSELIAAVSAVAAKQHPKPYDDTELLLGVTEQNEMLAKLLKTLQEQGERQANTANIFIQMSSGVNESVREVRRMLEEVSKSGIQMKSASMTKEFEAMASAVTTLAKRFVNWAPAMEECLTGLQAVNRNQIDHYEDMMGMQRALISAFNAMGKGKIGTLALGAAHLPEPVEIPAAPKSEPTARKTTLRVGRFKNRGLPSLSQMVEKKDLAKEDPLPSVLANLVGEIHGEELRLTERREELTAKRKEIEDDIKVKTAEIDELKTGLTEEELKRLDALVEQERGKGG
jgi:uncharacterized protein YoxC